MSNFSDTEGWQPQAGGVATAPKPESKKGPTQRVRATLMWADLDRENGMSGRYQVVLTQLSDDAVDALRNKLGITNDITFNEEKGNFLTVKSSKPIFAYDSDGNRIHDIVGNGSKAVVTLGAFSWTYQSKSGVSPTIVRLEVTDLIVYVPDNGADDDSPVF